MERKNQQNVHLLFTAERWNGGNVAKSKYRKKQNTGNTTFSTVWSYGQAFPPKRGFSFRVPGFRLSRLSVKTLALEAMLWTDNRKSVFSRFFRTNNRLLLVHLQITKPTHFFGKNRSVSASVIFEYWKPKPTDFFGEKPKKTDRGNFHFRFTALLGSIKKGWKWSALSWQNDISGEETKSKKFENQSDETLKTDLNFTRSW